MKRSSVFFLAIGGFIFGFFLIGIQVGIQITNPDSSSFLFAEIGALIEIMTALLGWNAGLKNIEVK